MPASADAEGTNYDLHPILIDGALLAAAALIDTGCNGVSGWLPVTSKTLRLIAPCNQPMYAWIRFSSGPHMSGDSSSLDIDLCDMQGTLCAQLHGLVLRRIVSQEALPSPDQGVVEMPPVAEVRQEAPRLWAPVQTLREKPAQISLLPAANIAASISRSFAGSRKKVRAKATVTLPSLTAPMSAAGAQLTSVTLQDHGDGLWCVRVATRSAEEQLAQVLQRAREQASMKALVLDLSEAALSRATGSNAWDEESIARSFYRSLADFPYPVVAAVPDDALRADWPRS